MNTAFKALQLKAKQQVYTLLSGHNLSTLRGEGYDFTELKEYQPGDDIRKINWTITAKLGKPYIKEFDTNRELSVAVANLMDASMYFGLGNAKQHKLTEVASLLAYATLQQNDLFTGINYTEHQSYSTPPTKQLYHVEAFIKDLYETKLLRTTLDFNSCIQDIFHKVPKPSLLFIISDFLEEVDLSLLAQKHEVIAIIIRDEAEENLNRVEEVTLENPKNHNILQTYFGQKSHNQYHAKKEAHDTKTLKHFARYGIRHIKISTQEESLSKLISLFN